MPDSAARPGGASGSTGVGRGRHARTQPNRGVLRQETRRRPSPRALVPQTFLGYPLRAGPTQCHRPPTTGAVSPSRSHLGRWRRWPPRMAQGACPSPWSWRRGPRPAPRPASPRLRTTRRRDSPSPRSARACRRRWRSSSGRRARACAPSCAVCSGRAPRAGCTRCRTAISGGWWRSNACSAPTSRIPRRWRASSTRRA